MEGEEKENGREGREEEDGVLLVWQHLMPLAGSNIDKEGVEEGEDEGVDACRRKGLIYKVWEARDRRRRPPFISVKERKEGARSETSSK